MKMQVSLAAIALAASFAMPAFAQDTIAGMTIPQDEMESVRNHCESLAAEDRAAMGEAAEGQDDHEENPTGEGDDAASAGQGNAEGSTALTEAADSSTDDEGTLDLAAITIADCEEAGLAKAAQ